MAQAIITSRPLKSGNNSSKKKRKSQNHRKSSSNPFGVRGRTKSQTVKYTPYAQDEEGTTIFHELDPSKFPVTKLDELWMESSASDNCCICLEKIDSKLFGTKKRHCKKCGRVVCIPCSDIRIRKHRVCDQCNKYYLNLNNLLNQWYRTNRNITHSLCGYDSYTLDTCSSLKRILFILNHYHHWILINRDGQLSQKREIRKLSNGTSKHSKHIENNHSSSSRAKVKPPFDITHISIKDFIDRLPKYDSEKFLNDIHHLKQMHFKKSQVFKISQYQKNHQWELRAYSWKKIGKCDRYGCPYGITSSKYNYSNDSNNNNNNNGYHKEESKENNGHHKKQNSMINLEQDIPTLLNNMHVVLLHGVDDEDDHNPVHHKELYDLLPQTPLSPHMAAGFFAPNKAKGSENDTDDFKLDPDGTALNAMDEVNNNNNNNMNNKIDLNQPNEEQEKILSIIVRPLSEIEWMDERHQTLCYWLDCCCSRFDFFSTSQIEWEAIQKKKQILSDILDYLDMTDHIWDDEQILKAIMKMIKSNLFRSLPLTFRMLLATPDYCQEDDSEEFEDPNYPHLCYVYEIALMLVRNINVDDKARKKYLGKSFIIPLTELFASEDVREREYLKAILHGIYARNMRLRRLIRNQMSNCCFRVIYSNDDDDIENGISECLQLVCSIIQGLTIPIKQEYKNILYNVLIPLHKSNSRKLHKFHETLLACCIQFILKDLTIGLDILSGLLKYWPFQSAAKSDMFLKEIVIIINTMMTDIDTVQHEKDESDEDEESKRKKREKNLFRFTVRGQRIAKEIYAKLIECMISDNHCLSEKALLAFGEVGVQKLIDLNKNTIWMEILSILFDNRDNKRHWCRPLHDSFDEALDTFVIRDAQSVQQFEQIWKKKYAKFNQFKSSYNPIYPNQSIFTNNKTRQAKWKKIQKMANINKRKYHPPTKPLPNNHSFV